MARRVSVAPHSGTSAMTSSVAGFLTGKLRFESLVTQAPSMRQDVGASIRVGALVAMVVMASLYRGGGIRFCLTDRLASGRRRSVKQNLATARAAWFPVLARLLRPGTGSHPPDCGHPAHCRLCGVRGAFTLFHV